MNNPRYSRESGFTMIEMLMTVIIMAVVLAIAIPSFVVWLPNYHLRSATRDLFSNMQQTKMAAIQANGTYSIIFNDGAGANDGYIVQDNEANLVKQVNFSDYGPNIEFGNGDAANDIDGAGFGPFITYTANTVAFTSRGLADSGNVYLQNQKGTAYVVGSRASGVIIMRKWLNGNWQ